MSKDFPALRMIVDGGRLVPATPFDQERLDSYRRGTVVFCKFTEETDRILVKKWFAILGLVLKQCKTPWKTRDEAHEAIKLALGIVNLSKTVSGQWMQYPKSLKDLEDPELQEALDQMIALLSKMTGVDVDTLRREAKGVGEELVKPNSGTAPSSSHAVPETAGHAPASEAEGASPEEPSASTISETAVRETPTTDAAEGSETAANASEPSPDPQEWLLNVARMLWAAAIPGSNPDILKAQRKSAAAAYPPIGIPKPVLDKAASCFDYCMKVVAEEMDPGDALSIVSGVCGRSPKDIRNTA